MRDQPFDDVAVEAAAKEYLRAKNNVTTDAAWDATKPELKEIAMAFQTAALTAAFKSMKDRGMAREATAYEAFNHSGWNVVHDNAVGRDAFPVTIIRHKENGDSNNKAPGN